MANITAYKGSDISLALTLSGINLDVVDNVIIYFYHKKTKSVITKFSIETITGYESIEKYDADNGIMRIVIPDADTENAKSGLCELSYQVYGVGGTSDNPIDNDINVFDTSIILQDNPIVNETYDPTVSYEAEASLLFSKMTTVPSTTQRSNINTFIAALKTAGLWIKMDRLFVFAGHKSDESLYNWIDPQGVYSAELVNSPTFETYEGFTGNGTDAYIKLKWAPSDGVNFTQDDSAIFVYTRTTDAAANDTLVGAVSVLGNGITLSNDDPYSANQYDRINNLASTQIAKAAAKGLHILTRSDATQNKKYVNGSLIKTNTSTSSTPIDFELYALGNNDHDVSLAAPSSNQISIIGIMSNLNTAADRTALQNAIETYMDANGKKV